MLRAATGRRHLLFCQKLVGQLATLPTRQLRLCLGFRNMQEKLEKDHFAGICEVKYINNYQSLSSTYFCTFERRNKSKCSQLKALSHSRKMMTSRDTIDTCLLPILHRLRNSNLNFVKLQLIVRSRAVARPAVGRSAHWQKLLLGKYIRQLCT